MSFLTADNEPGHSPSGDGSLGARLSALGSRCLVYVFLAVMVYGIWASVQLAIDLAVPRCGAACYALGATVSGVALFTGFLILSSVAWARVAESIASFASGRRLLVVAAIGVLLRVAWYLAFPAPQMSDMSVYFSLATHLAETGRYELPGSRAYWPPALPFFLTPSVELFGPRPWVPLANNILLFVATAIGVWWLGKLIAGERVGRIAVVILAFWPNLIFNAGLASKELLLVAIMPLMLGMYIQSTRSTAARSRVLYGIGTGVCLGSMMLAQPSMSLFVGVLLFVEILNRNGITPSLQRMACIVLGVVLIVAPWTYRNFRLFGKFIPVSNTAGFSLYVGNNPEATGGYVPTAESLFSKYDEVRANEVAMRLAVEWIQQNRWKFAALVPKKQMLFLGDDSTGAFWTLKAGLRQPNAVYLPFKAVSNGFWVVMLLLIASYVYRQRHAPQLLQRPEVMLMMLTLLYFLALHSVFESGSRHHTSSAGPLGVLGSLSLQIARSRRRSPAVGA